jgi:hypothetical protein
MDSSTSTTHELDSVAGPTSEDPITETHAAPLSISRERCSGCGATLASDQRYCVECGQRCGAPRLPFTEGLVDRAQQAPISRPPSGRARVSINSTVIAGVGTLLLAMGIGVLIGRSGTGGSVKSASPAVQVVTVPGAGGAAAAPSAESQTSTSAAGTTKAKGSSSGASTAKSTSQTSKKAPVSPAKTVTVGSPGKGPGYQKGHFTGNFFGE